MRKACRHGLTRLTFELPGVEPDLGHCQNGCGGRQETARERNVQQFVAKLQLKILATWLAVGFQRVT